LERTEALALDSRESTDTEQAQVPLASDNSPGRPFGPLKVRGVRACKEQIMIAEEIVVGIDDSPSARAVSAGLPNTRDQLDRYSGHPFHIHDHR
jgi:hypothetical protein